MIRGTEGDLARAGGVAIVIEVHRDRAVAIQADVKRLIGDEGAERAEAPPVPRRLRLEEAQRRRK